MSRYRLRGLRRKPTRRARLRRATGDVVAHACWVGARWWARGMAREMRRSVSHAVRR